MNDNPLQSVEGVDSIHIDMAVSLQEVQHFCFENNLKFEEFEKTKWYRKWFIFLSGKAITVTYRSNTKNCTFELGGLCNYSQNLYEHRKLQFLRNLIQYFHNRSWKVSRLDFSIDINVKWDEMLPDIRDASLGFSSSTLYFNRFTGGRDRKKIFTLTVYDKARDIGFFSSPLTRIELRLYRPYFAKDKVADMFDSRDSLMRVSNMIYSVIECQLSLYSVDGSFTYLIKTDVVATLQGFLSFLHGDEPIHRADPFRIYYGLKLSAKIISWMEREGISPVEVRKHTKGRKAAICKSLGLDPKTFDKAIAFFGAI